MSDSKNIMSLQVWSLSFTMRYYPESNWGFRRLAPPMRSLVTGKWYWYGRYALDLGRISFLLEHYVQ
jgi:hypothetical protein